MRTLKKTLALVLCLAMIAGLCTSAAFADAAQIEYTEAAEVMNAIGVLKGDGTNFNPKGILTRAEAAVMLAKLVGDGDLKATSTFKDMKGYEWAQNFAAVCEQKGFILGDGNGNFLPGNTLTGYQFGLMLCRALGYKPAQEGVESATYEIGTAALMKKIGLSAAIKGFDGTKGITREQAAALLLKTLQTPMVYYPTTGTSITVGNTTITAGAGAAEPVTAAVTTSSAISDATVVINSVTYDKVELGEEYFPGLTYAPAASSSEAFGRPAHSWTYNGPIGTYATPATLTYTANMNTPVGKKQILADLTAKGVALSKSGSDYTFTPNYSDADTADSVDDIAALTANGKLVEVYVNLAKAVYDIVEVEYTVEKISSITTNAATGDVTYVLTQSSSKVNYADDKYNTDSIVLHGTFAIGDVVTTAPDANIGGRIHVYPTTVVSGAQSAYNTLTNLVTVGGQPYAVATGVVKTAPSTYLSASDFATNSAVAAKYFIDQYGFLVATDNTNVYTNYAQLISWVGKVEKTLDGAAVPSATGRFLLADGTVADYTVNIPFVGGVYSLLGTTITAADGNSDGVNDTLDAELNEGQVYAYSLNGTVITLQEVATTSDVPGTAVTAAAGAAIASGATSATVDNKNALLTADTVYVLYDAITKTATKYVGTLPVGASLTTGSTTTVISVASSSLATVKVVFGVVADAPAAATRDYAYVIAADVTTTLINGVNVATYTGYKADGTTVTLYDATGSDVSGNGLYTWDAKNEITGAHPNASSEVIAQATYTVVGNQIINGSTSAVYNLGAHKTVFIDKSKTVIDGNSCIVVCQVVNGFATKNVEAIFVVG